MTRPGITQLLIASALDPDLCAWLKESPDEVFDGFELTEEEKDLLRRPDHRLLPLLGAVLARDAEAGAPASPPQVAHAVSGARALPDVTLALTLVPCLRQVEGGPASISYAVWVNALPPGGDPSSLPPPAGATLPGQPLSPLYAVVQVAALELRDGAGNLQVGLSASLGQSSNIAAPVAPKTTEVHPDAVKEAVRAVRSGGGERYERLLDLVRLLRGDPQ